SGKVTVASGPRTADGKSLVSLMTLDARQGDTLTIRTTGAQAEAAAAELAALVASGLGDPIAGRAAASEVRASEARPDRTSAAPFAPGQELLLRGRAAAPGLAVGRAVQIAGGADNVRDVARDGAGPAEEERSLALALAAVRGEIEQTIAVAAG